MRCFQGAAPLTHGTSTPPELRTRARAYSARDVKLLPRTLRSLSVPPSAQRHNPCVVAAPAPVRYSSLWSCNWPLYPTWSRDTACQAVSACVSSQAFSARHDAPQSIHLLPLSHSFFRASFSQAFPVVCRSQHQPTDLLHQLCSKRRHSSPHLSRVVERLALRLSWTHQRAPSRRNSIKILHFFEFQKN